jgi:serine/threonine protein kinase
VNPCSACGTENDDEAAECATCGENLVSPAHRALIGSLVLGVYRITDVLGQGGMSVVYKAQHRMTEQVVALKILPPELAVHTDLRQRFLEEAKALAKLEHENIVRLYHFGEEGGRFVLAMQFVEGQTFEQRIFKVGKVDWREAAAIGTQVCRALEYAHARDVVHRDIKPTNVLVREDGTALLMDFGIAKMNASTKLTATGQTMGTVRYMSPEQVRGQAVDFRSDLYSLGATLFEAVVGETPFDGATHFEIMMKHLQEAPPSVRTRGFVVPALFDQALLRAMAKDPGRRHADAVAFRTVLENSLATADEALAGKSDTGMRARDIDATPPGIPAQMASPSASQSMPKSTQPITGLAEALEPDTGALDSPTRGAKRSLSIIAAAGLVVAGAVLGVMAFARQGAEPPPDGGSKGTAPPDATAANPLPPPLLVTGFKPTLDKSFDAPEPLRILALRDVDAAKLAALSHMVRGRLADHLSRKGVTHPVLFHPLNIVVAPPDVMCSPELFAPNAPPPDCKTLRFHYKDKQRTLYLLDADSLEAINLPEGVAAHLCITTPDLVRLGCMKNLLPPFWDEVEAAAGK